MFPLLFELGRYKIQSYGLLVACGILIHLYGPRLTAPKFGARVEKVLTVAGISLGVFAFLAVAGSAIDRGSFDPKRAGFLFIPGFAGGVLAAIVTTKLIREPMRPIFDSMAVPSLVAVAAGRIGCFLAGCCSGLPTTLPWGVHFPHTTTVIPAEIRGAALHPVQLYQALIFLGVAGALAIIGPRLASGRTGSIALAAIAVTSLAIVPIRSDATTILGLVAWVALLLLAVSGIFLSARG